MITYNWWAQAISYNPEYSQVKFPKSDLNLKKEKIQERWDFLKMSLGIAKWKKDIYKTVVTCLSYLCLLFSDSLVMQICICF